MTTQEDLVRRIEDIESALRARQLSAGEIEELADRIDGVEELVSTTTRRKRDITELKGLGKEYWRSIDVEKYLREERDSWR